MTRFLTAIAVALCMYALAAGTGAVLYATDVIGTGATHNDCANYRDEIARERGIPDKDVPQDEIKRRTQQCLDEHELTEREAFRSEYLFWAAWPGAICAVVFLFWPAWVRALHRQDEADGLTHGAMEREA